MLKNPDNSFNIDQFYKSYLKGPKVFKNRDALEPSFIPEELPHRDNQIQRIAELTACALVGDTPSSFLCYGMTGTGKTATIRYVSQKLSQQGIEKKPWWIYINCSVVSTAYRILAHIYNTIAGEEKIPPTGLPKDVIFKKLLGLMDTKINKAVCFLVLDEVDMLSDGNEILYDLTRLNENLDFCKTSVIGISNKLKFTENLDPRVISSLGEEHLVFPIYDATELRDILFDRAEIAFHKDVIKEGVIPRCAAIAAKEHGDARKALKLLKKAGMIAERRQNKKVTEKHLDEAQGELEQDHIREYIKGMPLQAQVVLTAVYLIQKNKPEHEIISGDVYNLYSELATLVASVRQLSKRRISDYINDLALAGLITADLKSRGRNGRTKYINLDIDITFLEKILKEIFKIEPLLDHKPNMLRSNRARVNDKYYRTLDD